MKRFLMALLVVGTLSMASPALAVKQLNDQFKKVYAGEKADEGFKELVKEAKCYVCHISKKSKKERNPYGEALHELLEKDDFPMKEFKADPEKYAERVKAIFKKAGEEKSGYEKYKTFADRIKANLLPGGNVKGTKDE